MRLLFLRKLQNSIWAQIRAFSAQAVFSQIAYIQSCMSICEKRPARKNHRIWFPKRVLQFPLFIFLLSSVFAEHSWQPIPLDAPGYEWMDAQIEKELELFTLSRITLPMLNRT